MSMLLASVWRLMSSPDSTVTDAMSADGAVESARGVACPLNCWPLMMTSSNRARVARRRRGVRALGRRRLRLREGPGPAMAASAAPASRWRNGAERLSEWFTGEYPPIRAWRGPARSFGASWARADRAAISRRDRGRSAMQDLQSRRNGAAGLAEGGPPPAASTDRSLRPASSNVSQTCPLQGGGLGQICDTGPSRSAVVREGMFR